MLCEKPIALTLAEVNAMTQAAKETGKVLAEAFMYRHHPQTLKVVELVQGGSIGTLKLIKGSFSFMLTREGDVRLNAEWGGGSIWDVGCYPISYARTIAGAAPPALLVLKNTGSMWAKSPSACMRSISTEPTMPRQPTNPVSLIVVALCSEVEVETFVSPGSRRRGMGETNRS